MEAAKLLPDYVPLIDPQPVKNKVQPTNDASLLVTSPQEIQRNLEQWREHNERIHVIV